MKKKLTFKDFFTPKRIKALVLAVVIVLVIVTSLVVIDSVGVANPKCYHKFVLSTFNGSYDTENGPKTFWQTNHTVNTETGNDEFLYAYLNLNRENSSPVGYIYINVSDFKEKSTTFNFYTGQDKINNLGSFTLNEKDVRKSKDGWLKIYDYENENLKPATSTNILYIGVCGEMKIREIVVLTKEKKVCSFRDGSFKCYTSNNDEYTYGVEVKNAFDEQSTFKI